MTTGTDGVRLNFEISIFYLNAIVCYSSGTVKRMFFLALYTQNTPEIILAYVIFDCVEIQNLNLKMFEFAWHPI